jgi:hypothetical protein
MAAHLNPVEGIPPSGHNPRTWTIAAMSGPGGPASEPGPAPMPPPQPPPRSAAGWTAGRVVSVVIGAILALIAVGLVAVGATLLWAARQNGYLTTPTTTYSTAGYAITTETIGLHAEGWDWTGSWIGKVRIRVTEASAARPVFIGIAPAAAATGYLSGTRYTTVSGIGERTAVTTEHPGTVPPAAPQTSGIWVARASGSGTQTLTWKAQSGNWMIVVMNPNRAPGLTVRADAGATIPALDWVAGGMLAAGVVLGVGAVFLIVVPIRRASRPPIGWAPGGGAI